MDGLILKMEFLSSPPSERTKMVLALLISRNEATYLHIYSWEKGAPLTHTKRESCSPRKLRNLDRMPLLMIPANDNTSFTLVTESGLTLYDNVLSPTMQLAHIETPQNFPPTFMGSCRNPLWVQWAKPCRHSEYLKTNDDFFLVREDGVLQYVETKLNETSKLHSTNVVDSLNISVDTAFAVLEGPPYHGGDICISGGDMTDGAVCHLRARVSLEKYQTITNLAPIRDMLVLESNRGEDGKRLFVCSGKGEGHAAVAEIRRGLEARMNFIAEQEDCAAVTGLWFLPEIGDDKLTLIISNPLQTVAWRIDFKESKLESADNDLAVKGIQLSEQTLALAVTRENLVIQITPSAVTICSTWSKMSSFYSQHASLPVLIATINADDMLFATASMVNHEFQVLLNSIVISDAGISVDGRSEAFNLPEEPSSILILNVDGIQCLVVGTVTGTIHVLSSEPGQQLRPLGQYSIEAIFPQIEQSAVCSLAFLRDATLNAPALVCGTRNGWLFTLSIVRGQQTTYPEEGPFDAMQGQSRYPSGIIVLRPESAQHIGQTSIALVSDRDNQSAALLLCNFEAYHVSYSQDDWVNNFQVTRIWFTDVLQVCLRNKPHSLY